MNAVKDPVAFRVTHANGDFAIDEGYVPVYNFESGIEDSFRNAG